MRVLLVKPPMVDGSSYYELPLNYAYLAAALLPQGYEVEVLDLQLSDWKALRSKLRRGYDIIGATTYSYSLSITKRLCEVFRVECPDALVLLGGPHASFAPVESLERFPQADAILRGESEHSFSKLCDLLQSGKTLSQCAEAISNLAIRGHSGCVGANPPPSLDDFRPAVSAFHLFDIESSLNHNPYMPFLASRGCVYQCTFCLSPAAWGRMRIRSWQNILNELDEYRKRGYLRINFLDDIFSMLRPVLPSLLAYLKANKMHWGCETRLDDMEVAKIREFCDSGMDRIRISVESIHPDSLNLIRKKRRVCDIRERILLLASLCPDVQVSFMVGIPGETSTQILHTMDFAETLRPANCRFWAYSPLPGTPIYDHPLQHGILRILPHEQYNPHFSFIETVSQTNEEINALLRQAGERFEKTRTISLAEGRTLVGSSSSL